MLQTPIGTGEPIRPRDHEIRWVGFANGPEAADEPRREADPSDATDQLRAND